MLLWLLASLLIGSSHTVLDLDGNGLVDFSDFVEFTRLYARSDPSSDLDGDGAVTKADFDAFRWL